MIKRNWALSFIVIVVLIFMVGLSGCDMGSNTIAEVEEVDRVEESRVEATSYVEYRYIISGKKFDVTDEGREALKGWEIILYESNDQEVKGRELSRKPTGDDGSYEFTHVDGLKSGYFIVKEVLEDGWEQVYPDDYHFIELSTSEFTKTEINFKNKRIDDDPLYSISGRKLDYESEKGLNDWTIKLYRVNEEDSEKTFVSDTTTRTIQDIEGNDITGYYEFTGLKAGNYIVKEVLKPGWEQVKPDDPGHHEINLPVQNGEDENAVNINFENQKIIEELVCFDETIWAADEIDGEKVTRFVDRGNWATYIEYELDAGSYGDPEVYTLYADQDHKAGTLEVYDDGNHIFVKYLIGAEDNDYKDGYCGRWSYLTEYHLHISESKDFSGVTNRQGNPIPGQFDHKGVLEGENSTGWINIEIERKNYDENIVYIAAHGVAQWCGYLCEIE